MNDLATNQFTAQELVMKIHQSNGAPASNDLDNEIEELNLQSQRIQELIGQVDQLQDMQSRELMQECIAEILSFYEKGLEQIINILTKDKSAAATKMVNMLLDDSFICGLLIMHDLHPFDLPTRLNFALEKVRPYIHSHGGNVDLVSLEDGVATIRLSGSCKSCASSSVTLDLAIKQAIEENCPDLVSLNVEGIAAPMKKVDATEKSNYAVAPGWKILNGLTDLANGAMKLMESNGIPLLICKVNDQLYAYRNNCPACDLPLSTGTIENTTISCRLGHRYDIQQAGRCTDDPEMHLDPFPLLDENGIIKVALG